MRNSFFAITWLLSLILVSCSPKPATVPPELTESPASTIGYPSVADALADLQARSDVSVSVENGWTIVTESDGLTIWSFTPRDHPAHPAVAKRVFYQEQGAWYVKMDVRCEADKTPCDQFARDFEALNDQMREFIEQDQLGK